MPESLVPTPLAPFAALEDPRLDRTKRYHPLDIIFMAPCAVVSGANDGVAMEKFGKSKRAWLEKYLSLPTGTPCHDTFTRVFAAVDGEAFVACFLKWVEALPESTDGQLVAIDGKTARATPDRAKGKNPLHIVSARAGPARINRQSRGLRSEPAPNIFVSNGDRFVSGRGGLDGAERWQGFLSWPSSSMWERWGRILNRSPTPDTSAIANTCSSMSR